MKEMEKHLRYVLGKMCKMVGTKYNKINFKNESWFSQYCWTKEKQEEFKKWMVDYLYNETNARKEIFGFGVRLKKVIKKNVSYFLFNYGWRIGDFNGSVKNRKIEEILK